MKRKAVLLIVGCVFLTLTYLAIHSALRPRNFAQGRILLKLEFVEPTNEPALSDCYDKLVQWSGSQPSAISNLLNDSERMTTSVDDSAALDDNIQLVAVCPVRGTRILLVRFAGNEENAVWRVASNACVMLTGFYATNRPFELQTTNQVTCEAEHIDTGFWTPTPFCRRVLDSIENLLRR